MNDSTLLQVGANGDDCPRNHALCIAGTPTVIGKVYGHGYPAGKGWAPDSEAIARRLVAAWNACAGIPLEQLEATATGRRTTS